MTHAQAGIPVSMFGRELFLYDGFMSRLLIIDDELYSVVNLQHSVRFFDSCMVCMVH